MISPKEWYDYGKTLRDNIPELKGFLRVKTEDHLYKQLKKHTDYPCLVFVDLSSVSSAVNADVYRETSTAIMFVLNPVLDPKNDSPSKELEVDQQTHQISEEIKKYIRSQKDGAGKPCHFMRRLNLNSIRTDPEYNYHGMNGYSITFDF